MSLARDVRIVWTPLALTTACLFCLATRGGRADGGERLALASTDTATYEFITSQSTLVVRTGGDWPRDTVKTYPIGGRFQLSIDRVAGVARFDQVDEGATADGMTFMNISDVLDLANMVGVLLPNGSIRFQGKTNDGSDFVLTLTFDKDLIYLKGNSTPQVGSPRTTTYSMDAVAKDISSVVVTSRYDFITEQSVLVQTRKMTGGTYLKMDYQIEGYFDLSINDVAGVAWFAQVSSKGVFGPFNVDWSAMLNLTEPSGTLLDDGSIQFEGAANDGSAVSVTVTFRDDLIYLKGQTTPPPGEPGVAVYSLDAVARRKYGGGTGECGSPYLIYTAGQMQSIGVRSGDWDKCFQLMADIDLSGFDGKEGRPAFNIIGPDSDPYMEGFQGARFTGVFCGNGHTISNFIWSSTDRDYIGIFGGIGAPRGKIMSLGLIDCVVDAGNRYAVGALVGSSYVGHVCYCYSSGTVSGDKYVGGLMGLNTSDMVSVMSGLVNDCYSTATVSGDRKVGGLLGMNNGAIVLNCYSTGAVSSDGGDIGGLVGYNNGGDLKLCYGAGVVSGNGDYVGGLVGYNYCGWVSDGCYSTGTVTGTNYVGGLVGGGVGDVFYCWSTAEVTGQMSVGGLAGAIGSQSELTRCWSTGTVSGSYYVGGLLGSNEGGAVRDCYSTAAVGNTASAFVGGLVGYDDYGSTVTNCYSAGSVSGTSSVGGLVGGQAQAIVSDCFWDIDTSHQEDSAAGLGKNTDDMKRQSTFTNWEFGWVWRIDEGNDYPRLLEPYTGPI